MTPEEILTRLRHERHRAGLSLQKLADEHGAHVATVRSHEAGERAFTLASLVEHAGWFGLEVVVRPDAAGEPDAYQRGYDRAVAQVAELFGLSVTGEQMRNAGRPRAADWDAALADAYDEIGRERP